MARLEALASGMKTSRKKIVALSGGNPQIAKADGSRPVKAYIAAMPAAKRAIKQAAEIPGWMA